MLEHLRAPAPRRARDTLSITSRGRWQELLLALQEDRDQVVALAPVAIHDLLDLGDVGHGGVSVRDRPPRGLRPGTVRRAGRPTAGRASAGRRRERRAVQRRPQVGRGEAVLARRRAGASSRDRRPGATPAAPGRWFPRRRAARGPGGRAEHGRPRACPRRAADVTLSPPPAASAAWRSSGSPSPTTRVRRVVKNGSVARRGRPRRPSRGRCRVTMMRQRSAARSSSTSISMRVAPASAPLLRDVEDVQRQVFHRPSPAEHRTAALGPDRAVAPRPSPRRSRCR